MKAKARPHPTLDPRTGSLLYYRVWSPYPYPHYTGYFLTLDAAQAAADRINALHEGEK